jgi:3'(2'), 5'-bisphosphate nucleotidase
MVAFVENGRPAVGVVLEPALDRLTYAVRGGGCFRRDKRDGAVTACRVTTTADLAAATLTQSRSREPGKRSRLVTALNPLRIVETYSAGIKLALVARGEADLYLNTYDAFHDWDICAGHILVTEGGGCVTGLGGQELRYGLPGAEQRHGLLASNGALHETALAKINQP